MNYKRITFIIMVLLLAIGLNTSQGFIVSAESADTVTLRILSTGDLHGQITAYNYETSLQSTGKALSKLSTLAAAKEKKAGANNTILLDAGDFLYDYTSNYFYDNYKDMVQPIMKAMSVMNYDYITLGNHDFDYPWDYLNSQLNKSGLSNKVLLSNAVWHDNGQPVFAPSVVTTKYLTTKNADVVPVKIGIIGSTTNSISTLRGDYVNEIDALNNYECITVEANRLKNEEKADAVIVLLHGGIGQANPVKGSDSIGYALTKVASVDAVIAAHTHNHFPSEKDIKDLGISLHDVDLKTGRLNGKPVIEASSYAAALGIIDLSFDIVSNGRVKLSDGTAYLKYVNESVKEDSRITDVFAAYKKKLQAVTGQNTYSIAKGLTYNNYDTVLKDSNLYQLINNAKIDYGLTYIAQKLPQYKNTPVIACTRNLLDSNEVYISLKNTLSSEKVARVLSESSPARPSGYIQMLEISGKTLKEWLEYNASLYATEGTTLKGLLASYASKNPKISTLLQEECVYNWNRQYVFDGFSYTVDLTKKPRYTVAGNLISPINSRIKQLTYNGKAIVSNQKFILVTDTGIPTLSFLPKDGDKSIRDERDCGTGKSIIINYIKKLAAFGKISIKADNNWSLAASKNYTFLLGVPKTISKTVSTYAWNKGLAAQTTSYAFFKGNLPHIPQSINIIAVQGRSEVNNEPVPVIISATSKYAIKGIKYLKGSVNSTTDSKWKNATSVSDNTFTTDINGVYSILITDQNNNSSIAYITVDLYAPDVLPSPVLNTLTNRIQTLTGKALPDSTINVTIGSDNYSAKVKTDGSFSIAIKPPKAFSQISAYVEASGRKSAAVTAGVRKTGPDAVQLNTIRIGDTAVTGVADTDTYVYALIWTTVYVGKGQTEAYKKSDFYNSKYKIVETDITIDQKTGVYNITLPTLRSNMNIFVFSIDRFGTTSLSTKLTPIP